DPDLSAFKAHGGKLLLYAGWADTGITPENTVLYYESVLGKMGKGQDDWMRLFMVPGMGHCGGGPGPNAFDSLGTLESWPERGARSDHRCERADVNHAPAVSVSPVGEVQGNRQPERRCELGVRGAVMQRQYVVSGFSRTAWSA